MYILIFGLVASVLAVVVLGIAVLRSSLRNRTERRQMEDLKRWADTKAKSDKEEEIWRRNRDLDMR
jgi:hypothetical protein